MTFDELLKNVGQIKCIESRSVTAEYYEVVVSTNDLEKLNEALSAYFGPPKGPPGGKYSPDVAQHAEPYGGVRGGQTMYFRNHKTGLELALLWPWSNGTSLTVKIVRKQ